MIYGLRPMRRPLMRDPRLLIDWRGGTPFPAGAYTRPSDAYTRDRAGVYVPVGAGVSRTTWGVDPVSGLMVPATLLEPGGTNMIPGNRQRFSGHPWVAYLGAQVTVTQGQTIPGYTPEGAATRIQASGGTSARKYYYDLGARPGVRAEAYSVMVQNIGAEALRVLTHNIPDAEVVVAPGQAAHVRIVSAQTPSSGFTQLHFAAHDAAHSLDFLAYAPQIELTAYATSPILDPTASSPNPTVRSPDSLYLDLPPEKQTPGAALAIYTRSVVGADPVAVGLPGVWGISNPSGAAASLRTYIRDTGQIRLQHLSGPATVQGDTAVVPKRGDLLETLSLIWTDSAGMLTGRLIASVNRGPLSGADLPPLAPASAWSAPRLYVGSRGTAPGVYEWERLAVWSGFWAGDDERRLARARGEI